MERVGSSLNVLPRQRVKDTRAAVIAEAAGSTYIHPAALFALSQPEIGHHSEAPRDYSWAYRDADDASDETDDAPENSVEDHVPVKEPTAAERDSEIIEASQIGADDENAHLVGHDAPIVPTRTRASSRSELAAE